MRETIENYCKMNLKTIRIIFQLNSRSSLLGSGIQLSSSWVLLSPSLIVLNPQQLKRSKFVYTIK